MISLFCSCELIEEEWTDGWIDFDGKSKNAFKQHYVLVVERREELLILEFYGFINLEGYFYCLLMFSDFIALGLNCFALLYGSESGKIGFYFFN